MKKDILNNDNKIIGQGIATKRKQLKWSQEMLALKLQVKGLDVSRATVSKIELGTRQLYATELVIIANILGIKIDELLNINKL